MHSHAHTHGAMRFGNATNKTYQGCTVERGPGSVLGRPGVESPSTDTRLVSLDKLPNFSAPPGNSQDYKLAPSWPRALGLGVRKT